MFCRSSVHCATRLAAFTIVSLVVLGPRIRIAQAVLPLRLWVLLPRIRRRRRRRLSSRRSHPMDFSSEPRFLSQRDGASRRSCRRPTNEKGEERLLSRAVEHDHGRGVVGIGPGYRRYFDNERWMFDTSAAISWHLYKMGQARVERQQLAGGHLTLGTQAMWQDNTQVNYFGIGPTCRTTTAASIRCSRPITSATRRSPRKSGSRSTASSDGSHVRSS